MRLNLKKCRDNHTRTFQHRYLLNFEAVFVKRDVSVLWGRKGDESKSELRRMIHQLDRLLWFSKLTYGYDESLLWCIWRLPVVRVHQVTSMFNFKS